MREKERENESLSIICSFQHTFVGPSFWAHDRLSFSGSWVSSCDDLWPMRVSGSHACHFQAKAFNLNVSPSRTLLPFAMATSMVYSKQDNWTERFTMLYICPARSLVSELRQSKSRAPRTPAVSMCRVTQLYLHCS